MSGPRAGPFDPARGRPSRIGGRSWIPAAGAVVLLLAWGASPTSASPTGSGAAPAVTSAAPGGALQARPDRPHPDRPHPERRHPDPAAPDEHVASPYLPLDHWAYPLLDRWLTAGRIDGLSPFVRPYRRVDVARALVGIAPGRLGGAEAEAYANLERELAPELAVLEGADPPGALDRLSGRLEAGAAYRSQTHRDPLRPELSGPFARDRILERAYAEATGRAGALVGRVRIGRHGMYRHDPQFPGGRVVPEKDAPLLDELGVRVEEAYLELQTRYARLGFGRAYHNWGLPGQAGMVRSDYAYSEEEVTYRVGVDRIFLTGSLASLRDFGGDTTRYLATHRLEARPVDGLVIALTEAVLHGGPSEPLDLALVNPLGLWHLAREDGDPPKNAVGAVDVWWRPVPGLALYGSLLADATGRSSRNTTCCQLGGSVGVEAAGLAPGWLFRLRGSALQSLVYRTSQPWEEWSVRRLGLGWDKADLYLATAEAEWLAAPGLLLRPRFDLQVRGEGDFRQPRPGPEVLADFPDILLGETETTLRPGLSGRWRSGAVAGVDLSWDLGVNLIDDHAHLAGDRRTAFVGAVELVVRTPRWSASLQ